MTRASSEPAVSLTKVERHTPDTIPVLALDELGNQNQRDQLRPAKDPLSNGDEDRRSSAPLFAEVGQGCRIVHKHCHRGVGHQKLKITEAELQSKELPHVDGQKSFLLRPKAGSGGIQKMSAPPHVRGVGPKVEVRVDLS